MKSRDSTPLSIYLIRHGETAWTLSSQHTGRTDIPLTARGEDEARRLGPRLLGITFSHVLTSPRQRARKTCELVGLEQAAKVEQDLAEWNYGDYEGLRSADIRKERADWNLFRDGCPHGETPAQVSDRADRLIARLRPRHGNIALFSHGQFGAVLAARWIGLPVVSAQHFLFGTASLSIFGHDPHHPRVPVIALWNAAAIEPIDAVHCTCTGNAMTTKQRAIDGWENEGGRTPNHQARSAPKGNYAMKKLVVFDLDGTLADSKSSLDTEMAGLLNALLGIVKVAVISGGNWLQFEKQLLSNLPHDAPLKDLFLLPTCGTKFYQFESGWKQRYAEDFNDEQKEKIVSAFEQVIASSESKAVRTWGDVIEDRGSQITFSALGQQAPIEEKRKWDPDFAKRKKMKGHLDQRLPEFSVRLGGMTSVDVTMPGIDKAYGIRKLRDILGIAMSEMVFVGDALFPGGNDYPVKEAGVASIQVKDPHETKRVIEAIIACLECGQDAGHRDEKRRRATPVPMDLTLASKNDGQ